MKFIEKKYNVGVQLFRGVDPRLDGKSLTEHFTMVESSSGMNKDLDLTEDGREAAPRYVSLNE